MAEKTTGHIYTVSKLTREIKTLLEETYPFIWVTGEISNFAIPGSGHCYFTLKDQTAVISCVMFKNQNLKLKFSMESGMHIVGLARLALYEPRGSYQLIFEHIEPEGAGSMQVAFEQLKKKLSEKGYFEEAHKKPLPFLPSKICIITSPTGAAVQDIITVSQRRFSTIPLEIIPVKVQGDKSPEELRDAITFVNQTRRCDLIIIARGGGSLEDLAAFNSEMVATAVFNSDIPVISGVGHETDFSIIDFVADLRAPTPSAAAELALPDRQNLVLRVLQLQDSLNQAFSQKIKRLQQTIYQFISRIKNPCAMMDDFRFRLEDYESRLYNSMKQTLVYNKEKIAWLMRSLYSTQPARQLSDYRMQVNTLLRLLSHHFQAKHQDLKLQHLELASKLETLDPMAVLNRGYSISRFMSDQTVITNSRDVKKNDQIEILLAKGQLITKVEKING